MSMQDFNDSVSSIARTEINDDAKLVHRSNQQAGDRLVLKVKNIEYPFRFCPAGTFTMGSPEDEEMRIENETQHQVTLTRSFWMLETPVTQAMYESIAENNPSHFRGPKLPVETVSSNDCRRYIRKLNALSIAPKGCRFSLPTEAQWEYACRAGTTTAFHFGSTLNINDANYNGINAACFICERAYTDLFCDSTCSRYSDCPNVTINAKDQTTEVGSYPANAWGICDMHGNVWEECSDWHGDYPNDSVTDPTGLSSGTVRVIRGGTQRQHRVRSRS